MTRAAALTRSDWETPSELFEPLDREFRFTLDAAATAENAKCERWLEGPCYRCDPMAPTQKRAFCSCGHCASWNQQSVWLNPPYGAGLATWIEKCAREAIAGATVVALLPANTDTAWFALLWRSAADLRFLTKRVQFIGTTSSNPGGSVVAVWRPERPGLASPRPVVSLWDWRAP
jgi:site-specific DNA-methyltransferase (adenine-specific)